MKDAIIRYWNVRTADAIGVTTAQVEKVNRLEANADPLAEFEVEKVGDSLQVKSTQDGFTYTAIVTQDGNVEWVR